MSRLVPVLFLVLASVVACTDESSEQVNLPEMQENIDYLFYEVVRLRLCIEDMQTAPPNLSFHPEGWHNHDFLDSAGHKHEHHHPIPGCT